MNQETLVHLNRLLALLEEDASHIRQIMKGEMMPPYLKLLDWEIQTTKQKIQQEKNNI